MIFFLLFRCRNEEHLQASTRLGTLLLRVLHVKHIPCHFQLTVSITSSFFQTHSTSPLTCVKILQKHKAGCTCQIVVEGIMVLFSGNDSAFLKTHLRPHSTISKSIVGLTHFCVNASQRRGKGVDAEGGHWED